MAYRLKDYLYNDKLTKEQNILMDRLYKLRMSGMAEAFVVSGATEAVRDFRGGFPQDCDGLPDVPKRNRHEGTR